jgi:hypothetical protein
MHWLLKKSVGHIRTGSGSDWVAFLNKGTGVFGL